MHSGNEVTPFDLDLSTISHSMCHASYLLTPWRKEDIVVCELIYRRYLTLLIKYPTMDIAPTNTIDEYWHAHILHTQKYHDDCHAIVGKYIHHKPDNSDDMKPQGQQDACQCLLDLYEQEFGEILPSFLEDEL
jgi:hypothetical protein